ncbi:hypothetical protein Taro_002522 [Colocasia esculenta]|uniref:Adenylyl-sulfate kinase n=1 Tax=Colocasia esculenta TaxID=4460 RepID=A0A843THF7_COLES|nr:hypothetical protein [Colocasia esculenta]
MIAAARLAFSLGGSPSQWAVLRPRGPSLGSPAQNGGTRLVSHGMGEVPRRVGGRPYGALRPIVVAMEEPRVGTVRVEAAAAGGGGVQGLPVGRLRSVVPPALGERDCSADGAADSATSGVDHPVLSTVGKSTNILWHDCPVGRLERQKLLGQSGCVIWITGLSGSVSAKFKVTIFNHDAVPIVRTTWWLDVVAEKGENEISILRSTADLDWQIWEVAKLFADAGVICIASLISPYRRDRDACRALLPEATFIEVFMDMPLEVCEARDPKGLYKLARAGKIKGFTGIDDPYEPPLNCEIAIQQIDGLCPSPAAMVEQVMTYLGSNGYIRLECDPNVVNC